MGLTRTLKIIASSYKSEYQGNTEYMSEYFGDGEELNELSDETTDSRISAILDSVAELCMDEWDGDSVSILEVMDDDDCYYIAEFLGITPLNLDGEWTEEEEELWEDE